MESLSTAKGLLLMKTDKIGFGISITQGYGLVVARLPGTTYGWSAPMPIKVDGFSVGAVMGFTQHNTVICLATDKDIQAFTADKRAYKIGLDFGINLGDQVNESAALNTQTGQTCDVTGAKTKVFTLSKGYLVDVSMQGTSVEPDKDDIKAAYGPDVTPSDVLGGRIPAPREAKLLYKQLRVMLEAQSTAPAPAPALATSASLRLPST
ncbi:MAG: hypothetical protein WDW36_008785 [Sanguina aurantia]